MNSDPKENEKQVYQKSEEQLAEVERLQTGPDGIAEVFSVHQDQLNRMVKLRMDQRLIGRVDSEDIIQESYMEIARRINDFTSNPTVPFFIWARQITTQIMIDTHRRHLGAKMRSANMEVSLNRKSGGNTTSYSLAAQLVGNLTSPSQVAVRQEREEALRIALDQMDEIDREVLVLRHLEELSNNDVAQVLGIDKSAASKRYIRALKRLKKVMADEEGKS